MKILKPFVGVTSIAVLSVFTASQAAPMVANSLTVHGTVINKIDGVTLVSSTTSPVNLNGANLVDPCDTGETISKLLDVDSENSAGVTFKQSSSQIGFPIIFSYTYVDQDTGHSCSVDGKVKSDGSIDHINATGTGLSCSVTVKESVLNQQAFYTVVVS